MRRRLVEDERWADTIIRAEDRAQYADMLVAFAATATLRDAATGRRTAPGQRVLAGFLRDRAEARAYLSDVRQARWI
jgi:hypothetical protein